MNIRIAATCGCFVMILIFFFQCGQKRDTVQYRMRVIVEPANNFIESTVIIQNPPDSCFFLHPDLRIRQLTADGNQMPFHRDSTNMIPYSTGRAVILEESPVKELIVQYEGRLTGMINGVNCIQKDLVELAYYASWFPVFKSCEFQFRLETDLPRDYLATTNGILAEEIQTRDRIIHRWISHHSDFDVVLVASAHMKKLETVEKNLSVEIVYSALPDSMISHKKTV